LNLVIVINEKSLPWIKLDQKCCNLY